MALTTPVLHKLRDALVQHAPPQLHLAIYVTFKQCHTMPSLRLALWALVGPEILDAAIKLILPGVLASTKRAKRRSAVKSYPARMRLHAP